MTDPKTSETLVDEAVKQWGKLDIFVANAGVFKEAKFLEYAYHFFKLTRQKADMIGFNRVSSIIV